MPTRSTRSGTLQPPPHTATASTSTATASTSHGHNLFHIRLQALRAGPRQRGAATRTRHGGGSRAAAAAGRNAPSSARHTSPRPCLPGGCGTVPPLPPRASYGCGAVLPPLPPSASYGCGAVLGAPQLGSLAPAGWHGWAWVAGPGWLGLARLGLGGAPHSKSYSKSCSKSYSESYSRGAAVPAPCRSRGRGSTRLGARC